MLQRLDELIEESREIEAQAEKLQSGGPLNRPNAHVVLQFQEQYHAWFAAASKLLPSEPRKQFEHEQSGPDNDWGQRDFVADPTGTGPDRRNFYAAYIEQTVGSTNFRFTYPYERYFREPLLRQRRILLEAKHHTDIERQGRRDDLENRHFTFYNLHPKVVDAAGALFGDGHYRNAILQACIALTEAVKEKSEVTERDGTSLMQYVFSVDKPVLRVSEDKDERLGAMWLFTGAVMGVRNPRGHHLGIGEDQDATETFQWLAFVSGLMQMVDRAEVIDRASEPGPAQP